MGKKKITRRSFLKRSVYSMLGLFGASGGTYYYTKYIEPKLLAVKEETILSPKIPASFDNMKVLQFGDTHLGFHYSLSQLNSLVNKINELKPDLILFNGDLVDAPNKYPRESFSTCVSILTRLQAPLGKYWIYGNHDHGGYGTDIIRNVMNNSGFKLLKNESIELNRNGETINIAGLDDVMLGRPDLQETLHQTNFDNFTMLLCHEPDFADQAIQYPIDVQFSGHSHGGQIQLPFIGYLITPPFAKKYVEGKYILGNHPLQLYVTRGIGTTRLPFRFLCKPEINLYTLKTESIT